MPDSKLTSKGQTTIPKAIREHLKLKAGDRIDFVLEGDGRVIIRPATRNISEMAGILHQPGMKRVSLKEMDKAIYDAVQESAVKGK